MKRLFARKPMKGHFVEVDPEREGMKRHLGWFQLIVIGIGAIIGAGIFVITGKAAAEYAGPAIVLSFVLAATICIFAGLCYAELSALIPVSGGSYSYAYVALGELPAWIMGWSVSAQYILSASTVAAGWSGYLKSFLKDWGLATPPHWSGPPLNYDTMTGWSLSGAFMDLPAMLLVLFLGTLISIGIKAAAHFNSVMVVIKLCTIVLFIALGLPHVEAANWTPFIPENTGHFGDYGWSGIVRAAGLVFFAYIGFDTVSTLAQDAKNPQRDLPRGILGSLVICTIAYIVVCAILTGIVSYKELGVPDPMSVALDAMGSSFFWLATAVKLAILAGLASVVLVQILGQTRIFMAIGEDGLLPKKIGKIDPKTKTPLIATLITTVATMSLAGLFTVDVLAQLVSMITLFIFAIVCAAVLVLRKTQPDHKRPFRVPFVPWIPLLGIFFCFAQMLALPAITWLQMILWFALGILVYFRYGIKHSNISSR